MLRITKRPIQQAVAAAFQKGRPYEKQSVLELVNSLAVFQACSLPMLVHATPTILSTAQKLGLRTPLNFVIKNTFFKVSVLTQHFCGGENLKEVLPTMTRLQENNIGAILDLAIEADLDAATMTGDAARVHCEQMVLSIKECVDIGARKPDSFIASKITALFPPSMLLRWSTTLEEIRRDFTSIGGGAPLSFEQFEKMAAVKPLEKSFVREMFTAASGVSKTVTFADINSIFSVHYPERLNSLVGYTKDGITAEDIETATVVMPPIYTLCRYAQEQHVKIMMDAEQTYFQPAIDDIVLGLCAKFNDKLSSRFVQGKLNGPVIFNTYQMYLKNAFARLIEDVERAQRMGYSIGAKVVRGAYMNTERKRALKNGYPSPINNTIDETHTSYNKGVTFLLETMAKNPKTDTSIKAIAFVVASHNKESEMLTCQLMDQNFIPRSGGWVGFGQLMGMQDSQTFDLAANGFMAYKYIPYGPVEVTIPYLHRRAEENATMLLGLGKDKRAIFSELGSRIGWR